MGSARLAEVVARVRAARAAGARPVVVFDLDSTLINTAHRHLRILREFATVEEDPALTELVSRLVPGDMGYRVDHALLARGADEPARLERLRQFWAPRFFSDAYCAADLTERGGVGFVSQVYEAGAWVYYLTARPAASMAVGTVQALRACGLPVLTGRTVLHLKADAQQSDTAFKHAAIDDVADLGAVVASFENEAAHAHAFLDRFPDALHFLLETVHSPGAPPPRPELILTRDFVVG